MTVQVILNQRTGETASVDAEKYAMWPESIKAQFPRSEQAPERTEGPVFEFEDANS